MGTRRDITDGGTVGESSRRNTKITWLPLSLMMVVMIAGCVQCDTPDCDCSYIDNEWKPEPSRFGEFRGLPRDGSIHGIGGSVLRSLYQYDHGCKITKAAPPGYKCRCTHTTTTVTCRDHIWCNNFDPDCPYPLGAQCTKHSCSGETLPCEPNEYCLGNDNSNCACKQGGGNCGGYKYELPPSCPCCHRATDWKNEPYTISDVTYDLNNADVDPMNPDVLAHRDIKSHSSETQSITFEVTEQKGTTSSFSNTGGLETAAGAQFEASIPFISSISGSLTIGSSYSHTSGETNSFTQTFKTTFICNGAPYKHTRCTVGTNKDKLTVPYTMTVNHKSIPNCACKSKGIWTGVQAFDAKLSATEIGTCNKDGCR